MTINGNINITCNESGNIKTFTIFNNNTPLNIEYSATLASLETIHNGKPDAHAELFNAIKSKNETQDTQISGLSSTKADKSELPTVNNATLTITQGGTTKGTFTANASSDAIIALDAGGAWGSITGTLSNQTDLNNALGGKVNTSDCSQIYPVIDTYVSGTSWYRIYSDGWCEMGGIFTTSSTVNSFDTVYFLKTFNDTNYFIVGSYISSSASEYAFSITDKTDASAKISHNNASRNMQWFACGYLASGQYTSGTYKAYKP